MEKWRELVNSKCKNWAVKPSPPDERDWPLRAITEAVTIPDAASLKQYNTGILDQQTSPLCAAYSIVSILHAYYGLLPGTLSPRFVYWQAKEIDGLDGQDGTTLRAVLQVVQKIGACTEKLCPSWPDWSKPEFTDEMLTEAAKYTIKAYARLTVGSLDDIEDAIASGRMVLVGSMVTATDWADGWILEPEGTYSGGHATAIVEYDKTLSHENYKRFAGGPNSWGTDWGLSGFYEMAENFAEWTSVDMGGMHCLYEAWAVEFDQPFTPQYPAQTKQFDVAPIIINGRTMVELRGLANVTKANKIDYDAATKKVTLDYSDRTVLLQIGEKDYQVTPK